MIEKVLYMAALVSTRFNPRFKATYMLRAGFWS